MAFLTHNILIVDDAKAILFSLKAALSKEGYNIKTCENPREALKLLEPGAFQVIISDYNMPAMTGLEFLKLAKSADPDVIFILMTAFGSEKLAIEAMKEGAYDYFSKPFELDEIRIIVSKACERFKLAYEKKSLEERFLDKDKYAEDKFIGVSQGIRLVKEKIEQVAKSDITVLIQGESGTGKEVAAEHLQRHSSRASAPFITLNCAAIPENLIESELFGYEKGAFTGAVTRKRGKFELANAGTIFLDEIGDMALSTQAKVLRVLQEREIERLGGSGTIKVDVRVIAATHRNLKEMIEQKLFREDLFYRLNVVNIMLVPLRERIEDISALAVHFLNNASKKIGKEFKGITDKALDALQRYEWPGNIRQLQNVIEGAAVFARGDYIDLENLPDELKGHTHLSENAEVFEWLYNKVAAGTALDEGLAEIEKNIIIRVLNENNNNQSKAAQILGIKRGTLQYKAKTYGLI